MASYLGDVNARARGLRTHLVARADLERLSRAPSLYGLQRDLGALGLVRPDCPASAEQLDRDVRRWASAKLSVLARWSGEERRRVFAVVFLEEERRAIQALLRGAAQGAAPDTRVSGLVATENLPERALRLLAEQPTVADVVRLLVVFRHPLAAPLAAATSGPHPSLFRIEVALHRAYVALALADATKGGRALVSFVRVSVDLMNLWAAVLHAPEGDPSLVEQAFVEGGLHLDHDDFVALMGFTRRSEMASYVQRAFQASALAPAFREAGERFATWEAATLRARIEEQRRAFRQDPSGPAPLLGFSLELREQVFTLRRIIWGVALEAPPALSYGGGVLT